MIDSLRQAKPRMSGVVLLGAEINFGKSPEICKPSIDWEAVHRQTQHCSVALRVAPLPDHSVQMIRRHALLSLSRNNFSMTLARTM